MRFFSQKLQLTALYALMRQRNKGEMTDFSLDICADHFWFQSTEIEDIANI